MPSVTPARLALVLALVILPSGTPASASERSDSAVASAGQGTDRPLVVIVMENKEYGAIVGARAARYLNRRFIPSGTLFTRYHALRHPSLPNYLHMTSGTTSGCHSDVCPRRTYETRNIFSQLTHEGIDWRSWQESMPSDCALNSSGLYAVKHNPAAYYANLFPRICREHVVKYPRNLPDQLRPFTFVTPNLCNDMHECSIAHGDRWLRDHVPPLLDRGAVVVITFDEGVTGEGGGGHIMTAVTGPGVAAGVRNRRHYDHLGLLAGMENWFGLHQVHGARTHRAVPVDTGRPPHRSS